MARALSLLALVLVPAFCIMAVLVGFFWSVAADVIASLALSL